MVLEKDIEEWYKGVNKNRAQKHSLRDWLWLNLNMWFEANGVPPAVLPEAYDQIGRIGNPQVFSNSTQ